MDERQRNPEEPKLSHERLDVFFLALELSDRALRLSDSIPRGRRKLADQLNRAGIATPLLVSEGANRWTPADKAHKFVEARAENGECAAAAQAALKLGLGDQALAEEIVSLARRIGSMLTRLIQTCKARN